MDTVSLSGGGPTFSKPFLDRVDSIGASEAVTSFIQAYVTARRRSTTTVAIQEKLGVSTADATSKQAKALQPLARVFDNLTSVHTIGRTMKDGESRAALATRAKEAVCLQHLLPTIHRKLLSLVPRPAKHA